MNNVPALLSNQMAVQNINPDSVNIILPTQNIGSIVGEFDQVSIEIVTISPNKDDQECWEVSKGKKCFGKIALQKIGNALGIQWDSKETGIIERGETFVRAKATGAIRKPNGEWISITEEKEIDLEAIEEEQRIKYEEESEKGFISEWKTSANGKPYPVFEPWKSEQEKQHYIDMKVRKAVLPFRKFKAERAMTGAKERVIKALVAIKGTYTDAELRKPFAFPRIIANTDKMLKDPELRKEAINRMNGSISAIFGSGKNDNEQMRNVTEVPPVDQVNVISEEIEATEELREDLDFGSVLDYDPEDEAAKLKEVKGKLIEWAESDRFSQKTIDNLISAVNDPKSTLEYLSGILEKIEDVDRKRNG